MALLARQLYFEAVKVGDELPPLVKPPVDRTQIARYAGASDDYNPLYVDELLAKNAGFPSAHAPGMLVMGFIGELVVDWLRGARLRRFAARFVKIVWPGDVITCRGRVSDRRFEPNGAYAIDIEVWAENQRGELVVKGLVSAQLYYSAEDDAQQRVGGTPLLVTPEEEAARLAKLSRAQPPKRAEPRPPPPPPPARLPPPRPAPAPVAQAVPPTTRPPPPLPPRPAVAARPPPASRPHEAMGKKIAPPKRQGAKARPAHRAKPAARASRPRVGSKPTGKKRR
ncbi:MAG TPA: MaoC/PaaZ C-terminal domain-containing protein [Anaeromyxobacteraceae bacterium]|nr:MaoC/PaaZ C-terminal domain-containing protein [Anaeromyxobacteraceae bacterium]